MSLLTIEVATQCEHGCECWNGPCKHGTPAMDCYMIGCDECNREAEAAVSACEANGGHDLVDDSTAGPDSGNVSVYCTRCPYAHSTWLY